MLPRTLCGQLPPGPYCRSLDRAAAIPENAYAGCADLARRYGHRFGVRTLDTLHVACALPLKAEQFWTFDEPQAKFAKAVGLKTS